MEEIAAAIEGMVIGAGAWVVGDLLGAAGYALAILLLFPLIAAGVLCPGLIPTMRGRLRGDPIKPFRWR